MVEPLENLKKFSIVLASGSPRRKELLESLNIPFTVKTYKDVDESYPEEMDVVEVPQYLSRKKADAYFEDMQENELIITADTVVALNKIILGKPTNKEEAKRMLYALSGNTHRVITGVTVMTKMRKETFAAISRVSFVKLDDDEIEYYINKYLPMDKAGSYGIQEWIGMIGVSDLEGSFFNVMGLPVQRLYALLKTF